MGQSGTTHTHPQNMQYNSHLQGFKKIIHAAVLPLQSLPFMDEYLPKKVAVRTWK